ncbi:MAG TPA: septal ring lytic transglycosylase RlpA family protein [Solirubrobacterales bacterium]|nr:septal ring lytic transglycosylase RlpA family protein [Solirubrobacterales bacterium]
MAAPAAHAATAQDGAVVPTATTGAPVVQEAAVKPEVGGRLSDRHSVRGNGIRVRGLVKAGHGRALVSLRVRRAGTKSWHGVARKRVDVGKKFALKWRGGRPGRYVVRLTAQKSGKSSSDSLGTAYVYRSGHASWYGPGFYGGRTACGQRLTASIVGVANKSLPCGTRVTFHLNGRTVTARVIDRGPFIAGRTWDLTPALKRKLHFGSTGTVHATS